MEIEGFEWDVGNTGKNLKHGVTDEQAEEAFFNDIKLRKHGNRRYLLGRTDAGRYLFVVFETRTKKARIICARDMTDSERKLYKRK